MSGLKIPNLTDLLPIRCEAGYDRMVTMMNAMVEAAGDHENHPLSNLLERAAGLVSRYE